MKQQIAVEADKTNPVLVNGQFQRTAVRRIPEHTWLPTFSPKTHVNADAVSESSLARDFSQVSISTTAAPDAARSNVSCSASADRSPFGGVCRVCSPPRVQAKLTIGQPDDEYEREADRVADQVMRMPEPMANKPDSDTHLQRACLQCDDELRRQPAEEDEEEENLIQTKSAGGAQLQSQEVGFSTAPPLVHDVLNSPGQSLNSATSAFMGSHFGFDFGLVRVHTDAKAAESARAVNAQAFTVGRHMVFGAGQYTPNTQAGRRLLVHELTHVIQQSPIDSGGRLVDTSIIQRTCQNFPNHTSPDTYCQTAQEARANIVRACPPYRNDFLYRDGPSTHRWRRIPGFGCAHHVAHILGISNGPSHARCRGGFSVTISQITQGRAQHPLAEAQINDIWSTGIHSGVVTQVDASIPRVRVNQCGVGGNAQTVWYSYGSVYR